MAVQCFQGRLLTRFSLGYKKGEISLLSAVNTWFAKKRNGEMGFAAVWEKRDPAQQGHVSDKLCRNLAKSEKASAFFNQKIASIFCYNN